MFRFEGHRACPSIGMQHTTLLNGWMDVAEQQFPLVTFKIIIVPLAVHFNTTLKSTLAKKKEKKSKPLNLFGVEIFLLSRGVVGSHDANLQASGDCSREDTPTGIEAALVGGGHHLGDVHHQGSGRVTVLDT